MGRARSAGQGSAIVTGFSLPFVPPRDRVHPSLPPPTHVCTPTCAHRAHAHPSRHGLLQISTQTAHTQPQHVQVNTSLSPMCENVHKYKAHTQSMHVQLLQQCCMCACEQLCTMYACALLPWGERTPWHRVHTHTHHLHRLPCTFTHTHAHTRSSHTSTCADTLHEHTQHTHTHPLQCNTHTCASIAHLHAHTSAGHPPPPPPGIHIFSCIHTHIHKVFTTLAVHECTDLWQSNMQIRASRNLLHTYTHVHKAHSYRGAQTPAHTHTRAHTAAPAAPGSVLSAGRSRGSPGAAQGRPSPAASLDVR